MYSILFRGNRCEDYGLLIEERPKIPKPTRDVETEEIPGKSGVIVKDRKRYKPIEIPVRFNFAAKENDWNEKFRRAKRWLNGSGELSFSDDSDYFYKVYYTDISDAERENRRKGSFETTFVCDPFTYLKCGKREYDAKEVLYNLYSEAHPVYKITGEGVCYLSVNGREMKANVGQNITIDTERMIAYRTDGVMNNALVSGDYQDLYLIEGENQIGITPGFNLKVIPNWRSL